MYAGVWRRLLTEINGQLYTAMLHGVGCGPFDGGCVVFAEALQQCIGGEIVVLIDAADRADHAAVLVDGLLIDCDGPMEPSGFITQFNLNERVSVVAYRAIRRHDLPNACRDDRLRAILADIIHYGFGQIDYALPTA